MFKMQFMMRLVSEDDFMNIRTWVCVVDTTAGKLKKHVEQLPDLKDVFSLQGELKIKECQLFCDTHGNKEETDTPLKMGQSNRYATFKQVITTEDNRHFSRELQVRIDDSHHNDYDLHINLDLIDKYKEAHVKKEHELGEFHLKFVKPYSGGMFSVSMNVPGKGMRLPVVCLIDKEDMKYHKKHQEYLKKFREGKLSNEDRLEFENIFHSYSKIIQKRKERE